MSTLSSSPSTSSSLRSSAPPKLSLRTKAIALIVTLAVTPVLIIGGGATYFASQIITGRTLNEKEQLASAIGLKLNNFVQERYQDVQLIAETPFMYNTSVQQSTPSDTMTRFFDSFIERDPSYSLLATVAPSGDYAFVDGQPLRTSQGNFPPEDDRPGSTPFATKNIPYFVDVRDTLKPSVSPLRISTSSGKSFFYVAAPILNNGQLRGVIYSRTEANEISNLINQFVAGLQEGATLEDEALSFRVMDHGKAYFERTAEGEAEIVSTRIKRDSSGVKIDGQPFQSSETIFTRENRIFASDNNEGLGTEVQTIFPKYTELRQNRVAAATTDISRIDGQEYLLTYVPIPAVEGLDFDWGVLISQPASIAFAPQRTLTLTLLLGTAIAAVVVGAIAAIIANRATRPIVAATKAVEKIGQGELQARLDVQGDDEIASLGTNINQMATQLQEFLEAQALEAEQERLLVAARGDGAIRAANLPEIFDTVLEGARRVLKADRMVIYRFDTGTGSGVLAESLKPNLPSAFKNNVADHCIPAEVIEAYRQGRIVAINDVFQVKLHAEHLSLLKRLNTRAILVVPIVSTDQIFGLLIAHSCSDPRDWRDSEINFLRRLGNELGLSVFWATLLEKTEELAEEQRQLKENLQRRAIQLLEEVAPISQGNLTIRAKVTADEIGTIADAYNATVESLQKIVLRVQQAASQVAETTHLNEASVRALSEDALQQAKEATTALVVVQEMAEVMQRLAITAEKSEFAVQEASQTVAEGDRVMNQAVDEIQSIRATVANTTKKVRRLEESSQEISKIVDLIQTLAAQTHMLALNASVEASRAGKEAKGFVPIANEVRALAERSAQATEEIKKLVGSIQQQTTEVVSDMEAGAKQVEVGTKLVDETRHSLNKIVTVNNTLYGLLEEVSHATATQSQVSETIAQTMNEVSELADKTSNEASQVSLSFEQLREVAQVLQTEVDRFSV